MQVDTPAGRDLIKMSPLIHQPTDDGDYAEMSNKSKLLLNDEKHGKKMTNE